MSSRRRPSRTAKTSLPACAELERLLERRNSEPGRRKEIDRLILKRFRRTRAVFVLDMAGFSLSVQRHGIIHHLARIHRMRAVAGAAVRDCGGTVVKFEADNAFATFDTVAAAVRAATRINRDLASANDAASVENTVHVSVGIGYGSILLACDDFYGDEVNLASKLGEDIGGHGEVLLTDRAKRALRSREFRFEPAELSISGIHLRAARLVMP